MSHPFKDGPKVTEASKVFQMDQAILMLAISIGLACLSGWLILDSRYDALTYLMLKHKNVEVTGVKFGLNVRVRNVRDRSNFFGYAYIDNNGKRWDKQIVSNSELERMLSRRYTRARTNLNGKKLSRKNSEIADIKAKVQLLINPDYPRFSEIKDNVKGLSLGFKLAITGLIGLILSLFSSLRALRRYKELKVANVYWNDCGKN